MERFMSKFTSLIRRAPKRFAGIVTVLAAAVIVPAVAFAWGPDRPVYTVDSPADHITFNSIKDNPNVGDERNFVVVKDAANTNDGGWQDNITVQPGKEYLVRVYVHNNAASSLNLTAVNTRVMASVPNTTGKNVSISGFVTADNATPNKIWDDISFNSTNDFNLTYVSGSAEIYNNGYAAGGAGKSLPDSIVTSTGALIGYNGPDGKVPGCFQYANYVYFKVKPQFPKEDFTVTKDVRKSGGTFGQTVNANQGETLNYRINYTNTGNTQQENVILKDTLPAGISYVPGSVQILNANHPSGAYVQDGDKLFSSGINIGAYTAGSNAYIAFDAKVASNDKLPICGPNTLVNTASAQPQGLTPKSDTANAIVKKECQPEAKYLCKSLGITQVDRTNFRFATSYLAENATFKSVTYVIKNEAGATVDTKTSTSTTLNYTQTTAGKYTVQATVTFTVDGQDMTATSDACKGSFEVKKEDKKIEVCELATKKIVTIDEKDFDSSKYSKNLDDCKEKPPVKIEVCDLTTKKIVTIKESDFDPAKYSKNLKDCEEVKNIKVCDLTTKQIVTINEKDFDSTKYSTDLSKCETPVTPPELPKTGMGENIAAIVGLGALIASAAYYVASRRALNQ